MLRPVRQGPLGASHGVGPLLSAVRLCSARLRPRVGGLGRRRRACALLGAAILRA